MSFCTFFRGQFQNMEKLSITHVVNMEKLVYKVFSSKGHDVCPSDNAHIPLRLMYVKNCRGGQPPIAHTVLRCVVFNLFMPFRKSRREK